MSILTMIDGVPLFSTISEALAYGSSRSLSGYHTMLHDGQNGYMAGASHASALGTIAAQSQPQATPTTTIPPTTTTTTSSGGGGGGY